LIFISKKIDLNCHKDTKPRRITKGIGMQNQKLRRSLIFVAPSAWWGNENFDEVIVLEGFLSEEYKDHYKISNH